MIVGGSVKARDVLDTAAFDRSKNTDYTLRYATHLVFGRLHALIFNYHLCSECDNCSASLQYISERGQLPQVFRSLPISADEMFKANGQLPFTPSVIELDEDEKSVSQLTPRVPIINPANANRNIFHSDAKWQIMGRPAQEKTLNSSRSFGSFPMMRLTSNDEGCCVEMSMD